ncbi:monovalent cation/H(+) antiporter subunit G [Candidatus Oleimmundimicrobium sp.]|uniref:monovalent cation/H(+) antiporter subunit G n=1 Tax=Candidatus Oleimmundimicrobium sp. TaxID=3060597 RepID=UPI00272289C0|nr:monovalent cation/H(+) antiporter subunit G [Candidatus Oleimmundimicrobium sp.]MDO8886899.1 monovalent cation/H(+) antiporter subunit G [Candidatus Oleimmundimicrobium sp.]
MFEVTVNSLVVLFLSTGVFFLWVGIIGIVRLPDVYSRLHAATKCDILGAGLTLTGLVIYEGFSFNALKLLVIAALLLSSSLVIGHAIARAARRTDLVPWHENREEKIMMEKEKLFREIFKV